MVEEHPSWGDLEQLALGQLTDPSMLRTLHHLLEGCPVCREVLAGSWGTHAGGGSRPIPFPPAEGGGDSYDQVFERVFRQVTAREASIQQEHAAGCKLFEELMRHPFAHRLLLVTNSPRFHDRMLCERLLEESHSAGFQAPAQAIELARIAVEVARSLRVEDVESLESWNGLQARSWAQLGNALRISSDHAGAEEALNLAESFLAGNRVGLIDKARVLDLQASLLRDQRRFTQAAHKLDRVIAIYQEIGQWNLLGRALKQKSMICGEAGDTEAEISLLRRALDLLDPEEEPRTFLAARHNLILALNDGGRPREAFVLLFHTRPLYLKMGDRMNLLRLRWVEGSVSLGLGRVEQAAVAFREVRDAFLELDVDYDAALVSLDLAGAYILQGRSAEVKRLATETLAVFQARNIHREAMAALLVFCKAAEVDEAGLGLVHEVSEFLKRARNNPDCSFTRPA